MNIGSIGSFASYAPSRAGQASKAVDRYGSVPAPEVARVEFRDQPPDRSGQRDEKTEDSHVGHVKVSLSAEAQEILKRDSELSSEEQKEVDDMKARDREVRTHEQAHLAAAGSYARGGPKYEYDTGPDGRQYAVAGEVSIDTSEIPNDPRATLDKARVVKRAALAPQEPSTQDKRVAAEAEAMAQKAQREVAQERSSERAEDHG